jgi:hypothetical protein
MMHSRLEHAENSINIHDTFASRKTLINLELSNRESKQVSMADPVSSERNGYTL